MFTVCTSIYLGCFRCNASEFNDDDNRTCRRLNLDTRVTTERYQWKVSVVVNDNVTLDYYTYETDPPYHTQTSHVEWLIFISTHVTPSISCCNTLVDNDGDDKGEVVEQQRRGHSKNQRPNG